MQTASEHHRGSTSTIAAAAIRNPAYVLAVLLLGLTASPSRAECGSLAAEVDARCYTNNLQAAVDDAFARRLTGTSRRISAPRMTAADRRPRGLAWLVAVIVIATVAWWVWSSWR